MTRFTYRYTYPVEDEVLEEYETEHGKFSCIAESREEADKLFDKHCEDEYHDEVWDYDQIDLKDVKEETIGEPEDPRQMRLFKKPKEKPYVPPPLQYDPNDRQLKIVDARARGKTKRNSKRGA